MFKHLVRSSLLVSALLLLTMTVAPIASAPTPASGMDLLNKIQEIVEPSRLPFPANVVYFYADFYHLFRIFNYNENNFVKVKMVASILTVISAVILIVLLLLFAKGLFCFRPYVLDDPSPKSGRGQAV